MKSLRHDAMSRRTFLGAAAGATLATAFRIPGASASAPREFRLKPAPGRTRLVNTPNPETAVWAYNGGVPGPEIRVRQGERVRVVVDNGLAEATTVHWHGVRLPNAMDGVPHLTQPPIAPGGSFVYEFDAVDAGTFWYHPHQRSFEQVGRGLAGPLIIEEREPIAVDRDVTWVLDDWRLTESAAISDDFGNLHDLTHAGRLGNTATINGGEPEAFPVRAGERVRLRLINAANARTFGLTFEGHAPRVIALDGQPVTPHAPDGGRVVIGAAMRVDLILDMTGAPGKRFAVVDGYYERAKYKLIDIAYSAERLRDRPPAGDVALPANPLTEPDLKAAERHDVTFGGGMMGNMRSAMMNGRDTDIRDMMRAGMAWAVNGVTMTGHVMEPMITFKRGRSYVLALHNHTEWPHPIHLHGHSFRVITRNGKPTAHREWQDTVLMEPHDFVDIAFVADNPGDWMFHCHILEHQAAGMMAVLRVA